MKKIIWKYFSSHVTHCMKYRQHFCPSCNCLCRWYSCKVSWYSGSCITILFETIAGSIWLSSLFLRGEPGSSQLHKIEKGKGGHCKRGLSAGEISRISESLHCQESLENGQILLCFPHSEASLESPACPKSLENGPCEKSPLPGDPFAQSPTKTF